eukprot:314388-Rhodomonas_salina.6
MSNISRPRPNQKGGGLKSRCRFQVESVSRIQGECFRFGGPGSELESRGCQILGLVFRVDFGSRVQGVGCGVQGLRSRVQIVQVSRV